MALQEPVRGSPDNPRSRRLRNPDRPRWRERYRQNTSLKRVKKLDADRNGGPNSQSEDLKLHPTQLRSRVKAFADDPRQAFPDQG